MSQAYQLPIDPSSLDEFLAKLDGIVAKAKEADSAVKGISIPNRGGGGGGSSTASRMGSGGGGNPALAARPYRPNGPYDRPSYERDRLDQLKSSGFDPSSAAYRNQQYRILMADRARSRADAALNPDGSSAMDAVFARTRFNLPGGMAPLGRDLKHFTDPKTLGPLLKELGVGEELAGVLGGVIGAAGIAAGAVAAAGATAYGLAKGSSQLLQPGAAGALAIGGSSQTIGQSLALSGGDASRPQAIADALRQGTYGAGYMRSKGIVDLGGMQVDKGSNYIKVIEQLRKINNRDQRTRIARDLGLNEQEFQMSYASDSAFQSLKISRGKEGSDEDLRAKADADAAMDSAGNSLSRLGRTIAKPIANGVTALTTPINQILEGDLLRGIPNALKNLVPGGTLIPNWVQSQKQRENEADKSSAKSSSDGFRSARDEMIGGGVRSTLPVGIANNITMNGLQQQAMVQGAYQW